MIELTQQENFLIGGGHDIDALAEKDHARILVISDSHNHFNLLASILRQFGKSCDAFAFCGDGLSDIARLYTTAQEDESFRQVIPPVIAFVSGNCDPVSYPVSHEKQIVAPFSQIISVNGHNIMIVHGHREGVDYGFENLGLKMKLSGCKTALYGHTHIAMEYCDNKNDYKFINPGSCSTPRGSQPPGFAILTVEKSFIDTAFIKIDNTKGGENSFKIWQPGY